MTTQRPDDLTEFVSFALARPARFGRESFAGDPSVQDFVEVVLRSFSLDVAFFVAWECPPDVAVIETPGGSALIRSERLDGLLVEFVRLRQVQPLFGADLGREVATAQVLRWLAEFLIGYRQPGLALDALAHRPSLPGLDLGIWSPHRDETLASVPHEVRVALQCFSLGHELGHLVRGRARATTLGEVVDGLPVMAHIDHDQRARGASRAELEQFRAVADASVDAQQLLTEITADLFGIDALAEYLIRAEGCPPEDAVDLAMAACEALIFTYYAKELARLLGQVAAGQATEEDYRVAEFAAGLTWAARSRAIGRHAGISLTLFEEGAGGDFQERVDRIDALIIAGDAARRQLSEALDTAQESLLQVALAYAAGLRPDDEITARLGDDDALRLELFSLLVAFGCSGAVDVTAYLSSMGRPTHRLGDSASGLPPPSAS